MFKCGCVGPYQSQMEPVEVRDDHHKAASQDEHRKKENLFW
jgi:hypothetical protein